ncbi:O-acetylhomoserine aminocarboxypropyltransferase/cysteine synthase family protein [Clostridium sp. LIBA-8841]|uniref:O-acetylhomoserine aminocarboxypropyltransferase/cysteine synthase family protein n=1 Tax=Clostridium sp. LIBA-8841 TaxID=2987530 RepID=UPI002AC5D7EF|nr:O-acetylhomoserine aminocarboxypropyltransferase/cysteine synthase family protein [Clostridium sp. LIBA-8841]MDZ5254783.1 O-acetylhomoserine aminocarboxypropyltransferase/cysteine synthase [Clostridium sp. LIBA-8841]
MSKNFSKDTLCIRGGFNPKSGEPVTQPLVQSTSYKFESCDQVANLFDLKEDGHIYTRISNPTVSNLEEKFLALEVGVGAVSVSSGQSAVLLAVLNICKAGEHIVVLSTVYGGTFNLLGTTLKKLGIDTTFVSPDCSEGELEESIKDNTKLIIGESLGNPSLRILDMKKFSKVAKSNGIPLIVDNTVATPYLFNPLEHGANIVVHSTSKYSDGHSLALGGIIVDGGNFNWDNGKFSCLVEPDESYHGLKYVETFGEAAYITKLRVTLLRDLGCTTSPFNAYLTNIGLETLHLRMERHSSNALTLARFLEKNENVTWVDYPLLESHKDYELAREYFTKGASGLLSFGIRGGREAAKKFIDNLQLAQLVVHLGDVRTTLLHPASTTHRQLSSEDLIKAGVTEDLIRVSVGIEGIEDIIKDFEQAFSKLGDE